MTSVWYAPGTRLSSKEAVISSSTVVLGVAEQGPVTRITAACAGFTGPRRHDKDRAERVKRLGAERNPSREVKPFNGPLYLPAVVCASGQGARAKGCDRRR